MISGDSIGVTKNGVILEKPKDKAEAIEMISTLEGTAHQIMTAVFVAVRVEEEEKADLITTKHKFKVFSGI